MGRVQLPNYPVPGEALSVAQLQKKVRPVSHTSTRCCCCCGALPSCTSPRVMLPPQLQLIPNPPSLPLPLLYPTHPTHPQVKSQDTERRKGIPWTEEEHRLFLMGLAKYGKGDWRSISRNFVITRTPTQARSGWGWWGGVGWVCVGWVCVGWVCVGCVCGGGGWGWGWGGGWGGVGCYACMPLCWIAG